MDFYILVECASCYEDIHYGINRTYITHEGLPVVSASSVANESFECGHCGAVSYTGDLEMFCD